MSTFADLLRGHRTRRSLSQEELAERAVLTAKAVGALERGERRRPFPHTVRALADALDLDEAERTAFAAAVPGRLGPPAGRRSTGAEPSVPGGPVIGRDTELTEVGALLKDRSRRIVTLTGPGGVGKTTLAMLVARSAGADFPGGVVVVELAEVIDADGVLPAAAAALGVAGRFDGTVASLVSLLTGRRVLLVLDNVEHVLACAPDLASLVAGCPELVVLATGRAALRVRAEQEVPVAPLDFEEAMRMFRERMAAGGSLGAGGPRADAAVAALCRRTDGLPLAVELAASAAALLGPSTLLDQLDAGAPTVNEARDLPARQRSMAATVDWSYRLLDGPARSLLRRLSACAGRFSLVLAADLAGEEPEVVLVGLADLLEHSLVVRTSEVEGVERFRLLEPVRERIAALLSPAETAEARAVLARSVLEDARALGEDLRGPGQGSALRLLEADLGNVRVAFEYLLAGHEPADRAAELFFLVAPFLAVIGHAWEGRAWFDRISALPASDEGRARGLVGAASLDTMTDPVTAGRRAREGLALARRNGSGLLTAEAALVALTTSFFSGGPDAAQAQLEEARREADAVDVPFYRAYVLIVAGQAALGAGRVAESDALLRTAEDHARRLGPVELAAALMARAMTVEAGGRDTEAAHLLIEAFEISIAIGNRWWPTYLLSTLAGVAVRAGDTATGARFFGASDFYAHEHAVAPDFPGTDARRRRDLSAARDTLGEVDFDAAYRAGREMTLGELLDRARVLAPRADQHTPA